MDDVGGLLSAADGVLLPSRWGGLPLVLLEAMARGRPIVASAVGGVPDAIEDGVTGTLVPPNDVPALAGALETLHRRADLARRLGQEAAEVVRERFTWHAVVEAFESVYDEALGLAGVTPEEPSVPRGGAAGRVPAVGKGRAR
jgi:glycosyltransferase involved in cell wall biosynthesis